MAGLLLSLAKSGSLNAAVEHAAFLQEHQVWSRLSPAKNHELAAMIRQCLSAVLQDPASSVRAFSFSFFLFLREAIIAFD